MLLVTTDVVPGKEIKEVLGLVSSASVQSKSVFSDFGAGLKSIVGGKLSKYEKMVMAAQMTSIKQLKSIAEKMGANAIVGVRYATPNTTAVGSAEVLAYGTAVII